MKPTGFPGLALGLLIASVVITAGVVVFQPVLDRSEVISAEATAGVAFLAAIGAFIVSVLSLGTRSGKVLAVASGSVVLLFLVWWLSESGGPRRRPAGGAVSFPDYVPADAPNLSVDERKIVTRVEQHLEGRDGQPADARYRVAETDEGYQVDVLYVTGYDENGDPVFIAGGHCTVIVSNEGRVLKVLPGA